MTKPLTDTRIRAITPPAEGQIDIADIRKAGLFLRVTKEALTWSLRFTCPVTGKRKRMTLAKYPDMGLADARDRVDELRKLIAKGINPVEYKKQQRKEAPKRTFQHLADRYIKEHAERFKRTAAADRRNLRLHILPEWGERQFADISRADLVELVEGLIRDGKPVLANKVQALVSKMFSFAVDAGLMKMESHPALRLQKRGVETALTRVLDDGELRLFYPSIDAPPIPKAVAIALKLALLTGLRAGEVAGVQRAELVEIDDPDKAAILIPAERVKNKRNFLVPLSPMARQLVLDAQELAGDADYLFPTRSEKRDGAIFANTLAKAMARFAANLADEDGHASWKAEPPTPHDLRRTFSTRLSALGVSKEDRDACMNHKAGDVGSKHYDQYERAKEKRIAVGVWATALASILDGDQAGKVIPMRRPS